MKFSALLDSLSKIPLSRWNSSIQSPDWLGKLREHRFWEVACSSQQHTDFHQMKRHTGERRIQIQPQENMGSCAIQLKRRMNGYEKCGSRARVSYKILVIAHRLKPWLSPDA